MTSHRRTPHGIPRKREFESVHKLRYVLRGVSASLRYVTLMGYTSSAERDRIVFSAVCGGPLLATSGPIGVFLRLFPDFTRFVKVFFGLLNFSLKVISSGLQSV